MHNFGRKVSERCGTEKSELQNNFSKLMLGKYGNVTFLCTCTLKSLFQGFVHLFSSQEHLSEDNLCISLSQY